VIVKGRLVPFPGAVLALETEPPVDDPLSVVIPLLRELEGLLVPLRIGVELRRRVDDEPRARELSLRAPSARSRARGVETVELPSLATEALTGWWREARAPSESLAFLSIEEALFRAPGGIDALDFGFTQRERVDVPIVRDEWGDWIDARDVTLPSEAPLSVELVAAHRLTISVHWSQWLVPGNPLSGLLQRTVENLIVGGWTETSRSEHWTPKMLEHYRE